MHPEGGSWTEVRTHTPSKFSKVLLNLWLPSPWIAPSFGRTDHRLPKATGSPPLPRFQNRACAFPFTRLLSGAAPVMSTIQPTGLGDALSALHTYLGHAGFMSYACLLAPLPSTPPLPRQPLLGITPGLGFLGDPTSGPGMRLTTCSRKPFRASRSEGTPFLLGVGLSP